MSLFDRKYWARTALATVMVSAGVVGAMRIAGAVPGGETRPSLSFAGTLTGTTGAQVLTFAFKRGTTTVCSPRVNVTPGPTGAFNVEVPLMGCPGSLFDGSDVTFDVTVGSTVVARDQAVNPVPYARYADRVGTPDCPTGYERDNSATGIVLCRRGQDEMVRVGTGASAFWIDRYEASVWQYPDCSGSTYGGFGDNYPGSFPNNGQVSRENLLFACSRIGVAPAATITWFQAQAACQASGKQLPSNAQWQWAATGTSDPGVSVTDGPCLTGDVPIRNTGRGGSCVSIWGAQDMVGNVAELVAEWGGAGGNRTSVGPAGDWTPEYNSDESYNYNTYGGFGTPNRSVSGLPLAIDRGGGAGSNAGAGVFYAHAAYTPGLHNYTIGVRCVIER